MSVLAREIDAYQRALEAYQRQQRSYNTTVNTYNDSILKDANGNAFVRDANGTTYTVGPDGKLSPTTLSTGKIAGDYGASAIEGNADFYLMRQNPTQQNTRQITGARVTYDDYGNPSYYGFEGDNYVTYSPNLYRVVSSTYDPEGGAFYTLGTDASTYLDKPGEFTGKLMKAPDPTLTQLRKLQQPSAVEQERGGLISNEIIGRGNNPYL